MDDKSPVSEILELMNEPPASTADSLRAFEKSASLLSQSEPRLIDRYADHWVALAQGKVVAQAKSLKAVLEAIDRQGISRSDVVVRFIEPKERTLIL